MRFFAAVAALLTLACASAPPPPSPSFPSTAPTVVLVPGMTGSRLCDGKSGELLWGDSRRLVRPWDGGYSLALPVDGSYDGIEPCGAIREMRIAQWRKDIYGGLISNLERNGIRVQVFDYDWRRSNVDNARKLAAVLPPSRATLICQSNGGYMCRWLAKYGDVSLEEAERGLRRPLPAIERVILLGTSNGGALRILRELHRGRQYIRGIGRRLRPETVFTFPAIYEDLPVYRADFFNVDADLFDADDWKRFRWSVYAPAAARRLARAPAKFGTAADREAHLRRSLDRARRLHQLLQRDAGAPLPRYWSIQSLDLPTPSRATLRNGETLFTETEPGDRHATRPSQEFLGTDERKALAEPPVYVHGPHFEMITTKLTLEQLLRIINSP